MKASASFPAGVPLPFLPMWIEGETLYSWAARFHELQGRTSSRQTGITLFGRSHAAAHYAIPLGVAHFAALTRGQLGSPSEILMKRTALCELRPFLSISCWDSMLKRFVDTLRSENTRPTVGIRAGGIGERCPLRYCGDCIKDELAELGTSYWHLQHQLQCSVTCLKHQKPLEFPERRRTTWSLPHHANSFAKSASVSDRFLASALLLSRISEVCTQLNPIHIPTFADAATRSLLNQDVATTVPRRCGDALSAWFSQTQSSQVARVYYPDHADLISGRWIVQLLRSRCSIKPIHWLLLWAAILENVPEELALKQFGLAVNCQAVDSELADHWSELSNHMLYRFVHARHRASNASQEERHAIQ